MKSTPNPKSEGSGQGQGQNMNDSTHSISSGATMMTIELPQNNSQGFLWGSFSGSVRYGGSSSDRIGCGLKSVNNKEVNNNNNNNNNNSDNNNMNNSDVSNSDATSSLTLTSDRVEAKDDVASELLTSLLFTLLLSILLLLLPSLLFTLFNPHPMRSDEEPPYRTLPENDPQRNPWELFWGNSIVIIVAPLEIE